MKPAAQPPTVPTSYLVVVRPDPPGQYTAQAVGLPEIRATAATREEAIQQVRRVLQEWLASGQLVRIEVPQQNPLMQWFGHAKDDPDFEEYLAEIRRYRQEVDEQRRQDADERACSDSSSTPTT